MRRSHGNTAVAGTVWGRNCRGRAGLDRFLQCHIPETQTGYIHMRIGNSLGIVTTDVLAQLR